MQRHGDVKVQGVVIDHADGKEHRHHDHIVTAKEKDTKGHERHKRLAGVSDGQEGKTLLNANNVMHLTI